MLQIVLTGLGAKLRKKARQVENEAQRIALETQEKAARDLREAEEEVARALKRPKKMLDVLKPMRRKPFVESSEN